MNPNSDDNPDSQPINTGYSLERYLRDQYRGNFLEEYKEAVMYRLYEGEEFNIDDLVNAFYPQYSDVTEKEWMFCEMAFIVESIGYKYGMILVGNDVVRVTGHELFD